MWAGEQEEEHLCVLLDCCLPCPPSLSLARVLQEQDGVLAGSSRKSKAADRYLDALALGEEGVAALQKTGLVLLRAAED